jgi:phage terminase large subunit-like protein
VVACCLVKLALLHTIDPEDDPWEEASWIKVNPSWGQAVQPEAVRAIMRQARNNPAQEAAATTRHLNKLQPGDHRDAVMRSGRLRHDGNPVLA